MKQYTPGIMAVLLFAAMLVSPHAVFSGATDGLLLWYQIVVPTLFPFMLISNLLLASGGLRIIARFFGGVCHRIFATSKSGSFAVLTGFLCGYPMGAKVTADLIRSERITQKEGAYLLSFCNNTSPVFIINFIIWKTLGREELTLPTLIVLFSVPVLLSFVFRRFYLRSGEKFSSPSTDTHKEPNRLNFSAFDNCMMNSFESIVKVGGYIIFFSILIALAENIPHIPFLTFLLPSLEVTNGILMLHENILDPVLSYSLITGLTAFGGFCSVAQTNCMIQGTGLSILPYIMQKLAAAVAASLLAYLYLTFC